VRDLLALGSRDAEFTEYLTARLSSLRRVAYLLCRDWDSADDLVQRAITKLYVRWGRAAALATLAVIAIPLGTLSPGPVHHPGTGAHASQSASPGPAGTVAPPRRFNPLIPYLAWGWLPSGARQATGTLTANEAYITAAPLGRPVDWTATASTAGQCQRRGDVLNCGRHNIFILGHAALRVGGHRAYWAKPGKQLMWQYAKDSWVALNPLSNNSVRQTVKVADGLRYHVATRPSVRFAIQLTRMSPAWHVVYLYFQYQDRLPRANVYQLAGGRGAPEITAEPGTHMWCQFYPHGESAHEIINGHRVTVTHLPAQPGQPAEQKVCAPDADGVNVFYTTTGRRASPNAIALFAHHTRLLGADPASWTTQPLR
jgi:hypothetical protein